MENLWSKSIKYTNTWCDKTVMKKKNECSQNIYIKNFILHAHKPQWQNTSRICAVKICKLTPLQLYYAYINLVRAESNICSLLKHVNEVDRSLLHPKQYVIFKVHLYYISFLLMTSSNGNFPYILNKIHSSMCSAI